MGEIFSEDWAKLVRRYRQQHSLTQANIAEVLSVSQKTVSRWERGEDKPNVSLQKHLRDLMREPDPAFMTYIKQSVLHCPAPRALSAGTTITLRAVSPAAIAKRPTVVDWIGSDLAPIATGVLQEMMDDRPLQRGVERGEIGCIVSTTRSVLRTTEHPNIGFFTTTMTYFFYDGTLYCDAISAPAAADAVLGYQALPVDQMAGRY
ncbi:MAG: helix-turn-helix transcriptional regulator [Alphaproteobacteria bacterium]